MGSLAIKPVANYTYKRKFRHRFFLWRKSLKVSAGDTLKFAMRNITGHGRI